MSSPHESREFHADEAEPMAMIQEIIQRHKQEILQEANRSQERLQVRIQYEKIYKEF